MSGIIYNSLKSSDLDVTVLSSPGRVTGVTATSIDVPKSTQSDLFVKQLADQINTGRMAFDPPQRAIDLEQMIVDVIVETAAQGASLLEIHLLDPYWVLLRRDPKTNVSFIDVDSTDGFLWPPIELNFPQDVSDAVWRLCQVKPTTDLGGANMVLVFEDVIVSEMREHDTATDASLGSSFSNETRAEFIRRCVKTVSRNTLLPNDPGIRFIPLLARSDFTPADLTGDEATLPASARKPGSQRTNPNKNPGGSTVQGPNPLGLAIEAGTPIGSVSLATGTINGKTPDQLVPGGGLPSGSPTPPGPGR